MFQTVGRAYHVLVGRVLRSRVLRAVLLLASSTAFAQAINVLATPIKTRLYSPEDYGNVAVFHACAYILGLSAALRFPNALPLVSDDRDALDTLSLCFTSLLFVTLAVSVILAVLGGNLAVIAGFPGLVAWVWLFPVAVAANGAYEILFYWALRQKHYGGIARTRLSQVLAGNVAILSLGWLYRGPLGLFVGMIMSHSAGISVLAHNPASVVRQTSYRPRAQRMIAAATRFRQFPTFALPSYLLNALGTTFTPVAVAAFYDTRVAGCFSMALGLMLMPVGLVGTAVGQVFLAEASGEDRRGNTGVRDFVARAFWRLLPFSVLLIVAGSLAPKLIPIILGAQWAQTGDFAFYLSFPSASSCSSCRCRHCRL